MWKNTLSFDMLMRNIGMRINIVNRFEQRKGSWITIVIHFFLKQIKFRSFWYFFFWMWFWWYVSFNYKNIIPSNLIKGSLGRWIYTQRSKLRIKQKILSITFIAWRRIWFSLSLKWFSTFCRKSSSIESEAVANIWFFISLINSLQIWYTHLRIGI